MPEPDWIEIREARQHNLRGFDCRIPVGRLTVITGVSGSGKSSLAFHTLYAEGQRRFVESLSAQARAALDQLPAPAVRRIDGLRPAIAIEQSASRGNARALVATVTELHDFLRVLFSACGRPHDPETGEALRCWTPAAILDQLLAAHDGAKALVLAPLPHDPPPAKATLKARRERLEQAEVRRRELAGAGFLRLRLDGAGELLELDREDAAPRLAAAARVELVIDRLVLRDRSRDRLADSLEAALARSPQGLRVAVQAEDQPGWTLLDFPAVPTNPRTGFQTEPLTPQHFSFASRHGACPRCDGLGEVLEPDPQRLVLHPELPLAEAIRPWWWSKKRLRATRLRPLSALVSALGADPDEAWCALPQPVTHALLHGHEAIADDRGRPPAPPWEGLLPEAARVHAEATSPLTRNLARRGLSNRPCPACHGLRLNPASLAVRIGPPEAELTHVRFLAQTIEAARDWVHRWTPAPLEAPFALPLLAELRARLDFLCQVGLDYLTLDRPAATLSAGEAQRLRLATQIGGPLTGVLYILDEPSIGLHPADNRRLLASLHELVERGNTVVTVEHDPEFWRAADWLIEIGPGPGAAGGNLIFQGPPAELLAAEHLDSPTREALLAEEHAGRGLAACGPRLAGDPVEAHGYPGAAPESSRWEAPPATTRGRPGSGSSAARPAQAPLPLPSPHLTIVAPRAHNLKGDDIAIPLQRLVALTGPSGSGKSTLIADILHPALAAAYHRAGTKPGPLERIDGLAQLERVVLVDQSPLTGTHRSNAATYAGILDPIRALFAQLPEARGRGYSPARFSFNQPGGRCETCQGSGIRKVDMQLLPTVQIPCPSCGGRRYNHATLEIRWKGRNLADLLELGVAEAAELFARIPEVARRLQPLAAVGLGYLRLGQTSDSFSGGEAQRLRLAAELALPKQARTLFLLDEPSTGLHPQDLPALLATFRALIDAGHSVLIIEHQLDLIRAADWMIDLGPGSGEQGGRLVAQGPPARLAQDPDSPTGKYL